MDKTKDLDEIVNNLKQLVMLYGEITEELISNLEESNRLLDEAHKDIDRLHEEKEKLAEDYNNLLEKYNILDEENTTKITKIAELKQNKIPSVESITKLMNDLQELLFKAKKQNNPLDSDSKEDDENSDETEDAKEEPQVIDLRNDKASDEDGFNSINICR